MLWAGHTPRGEDLQKLPDVLGADGAAESLCPAKDRAEQHTGIQMAESWSTEGAWEGHCCSTGMSRLSAQCDAPACLVTNLLPGSSLLAFSLCFEILQASKCSRCLWSPRWHRQRGFPLGQSAFPADPSPRSHLHHSRGSLEAVSCWSSWKVPAPSQGATCRSPNPVTHVPK